MAITGPASPNVLPNAVPDAGPSGVIGGRSNPVTGNIRCFGDALNTVQPLTLGSDINGGSGPGDGDVLSTTPESAAVQLGNDSAPTVFTTLPINDSDGACDPHARPGRIN